MTPSDPQADPETTARLEAQLTRTNERLERLEAALREASLLPALQHQPRQTDAYGSLSTDRNALNTMQDNATQTPTSGASSALSKEAEAHFRRGVACWQQGHLDAAIAAWQQVLRLQPDNAYAYANMGIVYTQQARWQEAREMFATTLCFQPDNADAHFGLGIADAQLGNYTAAIADWEQTLRLHPDHEDARSNLAVVRQRLEPEPANGHVARALNAEPPARPGSEPAKPVPTREPVKLPDFGTQVNGIDHIAGAVMSAAAAKADVDLPALPDDKGGTLQMNAHELQAQHTALEGGRTMRPRRLWLWAGGVVAVCAALTGMLLHHRVDAGTTDRAPAGELPANRPAAGTVAALAPSVPPTNAAASSPADAGSVLTMQRAEPPSPALAAGPSQPGRMQIRLAQGLTGPFSYWFVADAHHAASMRPRPLPRRSGIIALPIPAAFNRPGAQLRVLDAGQGKVARVPVNDSSRRTVTVKQQVGPNLLQNADFTQADKQWTTESWSPARGSIRILDALATPPGVSGRAAHFDVTAISKQNWSVQCYQSGVNLQEGQPYLFTLWARADRNRPLTLDAILDKPDWHKLGQVGSLSLTPQWRKYTLAFTASHTEPGHARVTLVLGDAVGSVDVAGVALRRVGGVSRAVATGRNSAIVLAPGDFN